MFLKKILKNDIIPKTLDHTYFQFCNRYNLLKKTTFFFYWFLLVNIRVDYWERHTTILRWFSCIVKTFFLYLYKKLQTTNVSTICIWNAASAGEIECESKLYDNRIAVCCSTANPVMSIDWRMFRITYRAIEMYSRVDVVALAAV